MQLSARGAQKKRDESKKLNMYSKQWLPGDVLRVFYPIFWEDGKPEIAVGAVWGHNVSDIKALGLHTAFIPSTTDFDENAQPIGQPDVTYQFSQIARVFVNGAKAMEEAVIQNKPWPNESTRKEALKSLEEKYDAKNNKNAVKPIIGRVQYYISTEVLSVKLVNDQPVDDSMVLTSAPLSNQTITRLYAIMNDPKYAPMPGDEFLEVEWKYPMNTDKGESARAAAPAGLTAEYRLAHAYPTSYSKLSSMFDTVARDSNTISKRATRMIDPAKVRAALTQYAFINSECLDAVGEEDIETLCHHADLIHELDLERAIKNEDLIGKINLAIADIQASRPIVAPEIPNPVTASAEVPANPAEEVTKAEEAMPNLSMAPGAPTVSSLLNETAATGAHATMQDLLNNVNNAGAVGEDELNDIDFSTSV